MAVADELKRACDNSGSATWCRSDPAGHYGRLCPSILPSWSSPVVPEVAGQVGEQLGLPAVVVAPPLVQGKEVRVALRRIVLGGGILAQD
ncbi:hypothetical protein [Streptomyces sp. NPDC057460]|uniref:hypothetical protein n=1 Tax=Streptomyces sp. NPDC057460 TaxID=3346141 RepID=UPI0036876341